MNNYVISLTSAQERRKHIESEFGKQHIPFQFFDAITPDLIAEKAKEFDIDISNTDLTPGEIACAFSHIALWHLAKQQNLDYICIFEDDIYLGENIAPFLNNNYIDDHIDIVKLEKNIEVIETEKLADKCYYNRELYQLKSRHPGTAGYIITKKGINYFLNKVKDLKHTEIDNLIFNTCLKDENYIVWQLLPAICIQDAIMSNQQKFKTTISGRERRHSNAKKKSNLIEKINKEINRVKRKIRQRLFGKLVTFK